ncbi:hypothetical protein ACIBCT_32950 [Streptosporangium sp. NPDC050855]|uniref:hypothetical protein n=1 Tax=Streptosporangium sp. NPDC050855 TaxID=3366194 RepID=UPI00378A3262
MGALAIGGVWFPDEEAPGSGVARAAAPGGPAPAAARPAAPAGGTVVAAEVDRENAGNTGNTGNADKADKAEKKESAAERAEAERKRQKAREMKASGPSKHTDKGAVAYFKGHKASKRVKDVRMVGGYLRIYTDLPETADNSKQAVTLCEAGVDYLVGELGTPSPVVFVQAEFGENGNPVLANMLGPDDPDCRLTYPKQGK